MKCTNCGLTKKSLDEDAGECPDCGEEFEEHEPSNLLLK